MVIRGMNGTENGNCDLGFRDSTPIYGESNGKEKWRLD